VPNGPPRPGHTVPGQAEHKRVLSLGQRIGWTLRGPRRCCGIWTSTSRIACPLNSRLEDGTDPQCGACAAADPGKALARDAAIGDGRTFGLYLAWFGPGLLKIGLTAADRGRDRLLEQGAITYAMLAAGSYAGIRRAERLISGAGLARERIPARAKTTAWWSLPDAASRAAEVTAAQTRISGQVTWPDGISETPGPVIDQAAGFGLDRPLPASLDEVTAITSGARVTGELTAVVGRQILLTTTRTPLLLDMQRIAGWGLTASASAGSASAGSAPVDGLMVISRTRPKEASHDQRTLF
jgi:hypothetical protein